MADSLLNPNSAGTWKQHLDKLLDLFQGSTEGDAPKAVAHERFFGYDKVDDLKDLNESKGSGQCVALIQKYVEGMGSTTTWKPGPRVQDMPPGSIPKGTVIATFWNGVYPEDRSQGKHAAFYLSHDKTGIKVVEQWYGATVKQAAAIRGGGIIRFTGITIPTDQSGKSPKMSNIGEYFYVVLDKR